MKDKKNEKKDLSKELEELRKKNEELENQVKRTLADYQNLEKRIKEDREEWMKMANRQLLVQLLPAIDTLMLAEEHTQDEGIRLSIQKFLDSLEKEGVKKIETQDKEFDPNFMECIQRAEEEEDGKVVREIKPGYTLYDKVLRPAQVVVGCKVS